MNSKVSVIISVFNNENTLEKSIESIINQSYKNLEILICDDNSTDNSKLIIKKYENQDPRIKTIYNLKNIGLTKSLNRLIKNSSGEYIARQDADDYSELNRIEKQLFLAKKNNFDVIVSRAKRIDNNRLIPYITYYIPYKVLIKFKNPFIHGTLLIKSKTLKEIGYYDENFYYSQDYKLFYDLIKKGIFVKKINEPLYNLNMQNNISTLFKNQQNYYAQCVRKNKIPKKLNSYLNS